MARKSTPVGDLTWMDRAQLHTDLIRVQRKLEKALVCDVVEDTIGYIRGGLKGVEGEYILYREIHLFFCELIFRRDGYNSTVFRNISFFRNNRENVQREETNRRGRVCFGGK